MEDAPLSDVPAKRRRFRRRVLLWAVIGGWCILTLWLSVLPREEIRAWEVRILFSDLLRKRIPREWLIWRPPMFAEWGHLVFHLPLGVGAYVAGFLWGRRVRVWSLVGVLGWAVVAEASQFLVESRTPRLLDLSAGWLGIALGFGTCAACGWLWGRVRSRQGTCHKDGA
jgi:hypothetical protein